MNSVAVIGCGPAGLLAAEAARSLSVDKIEILAPRPEPSRIAGAQYLHQPIPNLSNYDPDRFIDIYKVGGRSGYAEKLGRGPDDRVSWDTYEDGQTLPMWSLREAYEMLWKRFDKCMIDCHAGPHNIASIIDEYDLVINTAPLDIFCHAKHKFRYDTVHIVKQVETELKNRHPHMVYSGDPAHPWYRFSLIDGQCAWEYGDKTDTHLIIHKPYGTDCDCLDSVGVLCVGRHGAYDKAQLTHHAYEKTLEYVHDLQSV